MGPQYWYETSDLVVQALLINFNHWKNFKNYIIQSFLRRRDEELTAWHPDQCFENCDMGRRSRLHTMSCILYAVRCTVLIPCSFKRILNHSTRIYTLKPHQMVLYCATCSGSKFMGQPLYIFSLIFLWMFQVFPKKFPEIFLTSILKNVICCNVTFFSLLQVSPWINFHDLYKKFLHILGVSLFRRFC